MLYYTPCQTTHVKLGSLGINIKGGPLFLPTFVSNFLRTNTVLKKWENKKKNDLENWYNVCNW